MRSRAVHTRKELAMRVVRGIEKTAGVMSILVGMCGMDSANLLYPVGLLIVGSILTALGMREERGLHFA